MPDNFRIVHHEELQDTVVFTIQAVEGVYTSISTAYGEDFIITPYGVIQKFDEMSINHQLITDAISKWFEENPAAAPRKRPTFGWL